MRVFTVTFVISLALLIAGFIVPPLGVIDSSVLSAVGLLLMFATLDKLPEAIKAGKSVKIQKGDFSAEVSSEGVT